MPRPVRLALIALVVALAAPAGSVQAAERMQIGFFDDPSFRWSTDPVVNLESARRAGASIIHVLADWSQIAETRPSYALNGNDPAYNLSDLDTLVETAPRYDLQVFVTITGAPKWANGGRTSNVPPTNLRHLTDFARMLATRYNGKYGDGAVTHWSIWNEPNLELFLKPQFRGNKIVSPSIYAKLYLAGYRGIKAGNPLARVAVGQTSNRGRDRPVRGVSGSVAPATFARLLAKAAPKLPFDAWATHPYPTEPRLGPNQRVRYPNVTMTTIGRFGADLQNWFKRRVPIWITEYAQQTRPEYPFGVPRAKQAADARTALRMAAENPYIEMFVWFVLRDSSDKTWHSGLLARNGSKKPSYNVFAVEAKKLSGQTQVIAPRKQPKIRVIAPYLTWFNRPGAPVGVTYRVYEGKKLVAVGQARPRLLADQTILFVAKFRPTKGHSYRLTADLNDVNGQRTQRTVMLYA